MSARDAPTLREPERRTREFELGTVELEAFTAVHEPGVEAIVGTADDALVPIGGDAMLYGDGGTGKTTLAVDLAFHVAAGVEWLGMQTRRSRVLIVENEGPRPLFRAKLRRKREAWQQPLDGRLHVLERPWAELTLGDEDYRRRLASTIVELELELVIAGPLTRLGMDEAGTLQEVRDFGELVRDVRDRARRPCAFLFVHHENKAGRVSGAWEPAGDTLLHVQGQGHGRTRLFVQKARWSSTLHARALQLRWADAGDTFEVDEAPADERISESLERFALEHPGCSWQAMKEGTSGTDTTKRARRDTLLRAGTLVNVSDVERQYVLWHVDDPARPHKLDELEPETELETLVDRARRNEHEGRSE